MYLQTFCTLLFYYIETKMWFWKFSSKCVMEHHPSSHVLLFWSFFLGPQQICYSETSSLEGKLALPQCPLRLKRRNF